MLTSIRLAVAFIALLTAACGGDIAPGRTEGTAPVIKGLTVAAVGSEGAPGMRFFAGTVESLDRAALTARIDGRVGSLKVKAGDRVAAGALLLTIDDTPAAAQLRGAESSRRAAAARLQVAEQNLTRYERLKANEAVAPMEFDRVASEAEQARGGLQAAEAAVQQARTVAGYPRVTAPYAGRVAGIAVEVGATVFPGAPLLSLDRSGGWRVRFDCPETLAGKIVPGSVLQVEIPALQRTFPATINEVEPAANPYSRSFQVKAALPDDPALAAGLFARAIHADGTGDTLLVPAAAVVTRGQLTGVYAVEERTLRWRLVKVGRSFGDRREILSGLAAGERIVIGGVERAVSGARVEN